MLDLIGNYLIPPIHVRLLRS